MKIKNICFRGEIRKKYQYSSVEKSAFSEAMPCRLAKSFNDHLSGPSLHFACWVKFSADIFKYFVIFSQEIKT